MNPHFLRRNEILKTYPEVISLFGHDWRSKYICVSLMLSQTVLSIISTQFSFLGYILSLYFVGATLSSSLFLAIHELTHDLFFASPLHNRLFSIIANLPLLVPFSVPFRSYHLDHHRMQGKRGGDTDIPSEWEEALFKGKWGKGVWCSFQILAYSIRPILTKRSRVSHALLFLSVASHVLFVIILRLLSGGWNPHSFLILSVLIAGGVHPTSGHFLSEHFLFTKEGDGVEKGEWDGICVGTQDTFSYYGILNKVTWNVGYHVEHHDMPRVPWSRLPSLRKMAASFYDPLILPPPWWRCAFDFTLRDEMSLSRRWKRD